MNFNESSRASSWWLIRVLRNFLKEFSIIKSKSLYVSINFASTSIYLFLIPKVLNLHHFFDIVKNNFQVQVGLLNLICITFTLYIFTT